MSGGQANQSLTVEGALLGAPLSIKLLQDCFYLLWVAALAGTLYNLSVGLIPTLLICSGLLALRAVLRHRERRRITSEAPVLRVTPDAFFLSPDFPMVVHRVTRHWSGITLALVADRGTERTINATEPCAKKLITFGVRAGAVTTTVVCRCSSTGS
jgi:hypothetical protein